VELATSQKLQKSATSVADLVFEIILNREINLAGIIKASKRPFLRKLQYPFNARARKF